MRSSLADIDRHLASTLVDAPVVVEKLADALRPLADPVLLAGLIDSVLADPMFETIAARSYSHANGFEKVVLAVGHCEAYKLRLHYWRGGSSQALDDSDIHSHRWDFASWVAAGSITSTRYVPDATGREMAVYQYEPTALTGSFPLVKVGHGTFVRGASNKYSEGDMYTQCSTHLHRAIPHTSDATVTLVLQGPPLHERTTVLRSAVSQQPKLIVEQVVLHTTDTLLKVLQAVRSRIAI